MRRCTLRASPRAGSTIQGSRLALYTYWDHILDKKSVATDGLPWSAVPPAELPKYSMYMCPRTLDLLGRSIHIEINHNYSDEDCSAIALGINKVLQRLFR